MKTLFGQLLLLLFALPTVWAQHGLYRQGEHQYFYLLTPTGYPPAQYKAIYQNGLLGINQYHKITENGNSRGLGFIPTILLGADHMPVWLFIHRRFDLSKTAARKGPILNIGGFFLSLPKEADADFSLFYANITLGSAERHFAPGIGVVPTGLGAGEVASCFTLHGLTRLGQHSRLVTENYIIYNDHNWMPVTINGWRYWKRRTAIDVAFMLGGGPVTINQKRKWLIAPWFSVHHTLKYAAF